MSLTYAAANGQVRNLVIATSSAEQQKQWCQSLSGSRPAANSIATVTMELSDDEQDEHQDHQEHQEQDEITTTESLSEELLESHNHSEETNMMCAIMEKSPSSRGPGNIETASKKTFGFLSRIFSLHNGVLSYYSHTSIGVPLVMRRCRCELRQRVTYKRSQVDVGGGGGGAGEKVENDDSTLVLEPIEREPKTEEAVEEAAEEKKEETSKENPPSHRRRQSTCVTDDVETEYHELVVTGDGDVFNKISLICSTSMQRERWIYQINEATKEMQRVQTDEKDREVYVVAKSWMYKKGKSMWSGWKHRFFVYLSNRELWYYETDHGMTVLGVIDLTEATSVRPTSLSDAPTTTKHAFLIETPSRIWKICPDVEDPDEEEIAVERWVSLLSRNEAYARVQHRGKNHERSKSKMGSGGAVEGEDGSGGGGGSSTGEEKANGMKDAPPRLLLDGRSDVDDGEEERKAGNESRRSVLQTVLRQDVTHLPPDSPSGRRALLEHHSDVTGQVIVTSTTSWGKITGNVRIDVLSESPWSAMEIARSLVGLEEEVNGGKEGEEEEEYAPPNDILMTPPEDPPPPTCRPGGEEGTSLVVPSEEDGNTA